MYENYYQLISLQQETNEKIDTLIEKQEIGNSISACILLCFCVFILLHIIKC